MLKSGNLCVDSGFGSQLFHGMKSHPLQFAIFCLYASELNPRYRQDDQMMPITLLEIVTSLCELRTANGGSILKYMIDDTGLDIFSFTEPEQLNSYLLTEKGNPHIETIRNIMLAAHCNKFNKILALYNHLFYTDDPISVDEFINEVDLIVTPLLITAPIFTEEAIKSKVKKGHRLIEIGMVGHLPYAIFLNNIEPNPHFIPRLTISSDHQSSHADIPAKQLNAEVDPLSRVNSGLSLFRSVAQECTMISPPVSGTVELLTISSAALAAAPSNRSL